MAADSSGIPNPWLSWKYVSGHYDAIAAATIQHISLTLVSVGAGLVISLPLALLATRRRWTAGPILAISGVLYTVPSLALFVALVPITGLKPLTVEIGLTAYTLVILVRNIAAGLAGVPADVVEAARGLGYRSTRLLLQVELPLALPAILAGLRVATVSTIALATIGGYVGYGGLGDLIFQGLNSLYRAQVLTASLLCVLLAVVADLGLLSLQRLLTPWTRTVSA
jgi:osmoprotectant transport system permease protein